MIIDSGTSYLLVPTEDFTQLTLFFSKLSQCTVSQSSLSCFCSQQLYEKQYPKLILTVDDTTQYTLNPSNYAYRDPATNRCDFKIMQMNFPSV